MVTAQEEIPRLLEYELSTPYDFSTTISIVTTAGIELE